MRFPRVVIFMILIPGLLTAAAALSTADAESWPGDRAFVKIQLDEFEDRFPEFYHGPYDLAGWDASRSEVGLVVDRSELEHLTSMGYRPEVVSFSGPSRFDPEYYDYEEIMTWLSDVAAAYPSIARMVNLNDELSTPLTVEARNIWAMKISDNVLVNEDEPAFIVDGTHHAREIVTPMAVMDIIDLLTSGYGSDPQITSWVNGYELWLIPAVNPDGLEYVFDVDDMWRKNRKYDSGSGAYGVDNNRNYSYLWGACGSTTSGPSDETYMGPGPESEEENQTMEALFAREKPVVYVSYHSYGNEVLYPYICATLAEQSLYYDVRDQYAAAMGFSSRLPSASGESFEDAYNEHGAIAFLTEIGTTFQPSYSEALVIIEGLRPGWRYLMGRGLEACVTGHVTDSASGTPIVSAMVSVDEVTYVEGEVRRPEPLHGFYNRLLEPGFYTVEASAFGYVPQTVTGVEIVSGTSTAIDFSLDEALPGTVQGTVSDETMAPLAGVRVAVPGAPVLPVYTNSAGFYTLNLPGATAYDLRFTLDGHAPTTVEDVWVDEGGTTVQDVTLPDWPSILIWEPDPTPGSGAAVQDTLSALGWNSMLVTDLFEYDIDLRGYQAVFVLVGIYSSNYTFSAGSAEETALVQFLDNGGKLYMEGGDIWCYDSQPATLKPYFNVLNEGDGGSDLLTIEGVSGVFTDGMSFGYTGENSFMDQLGALLPAYEIFTNPADGYGHGVAHNAGTYKTVAASFEFGGLVDGVTPSTKLDLMAAYADFFELTSEEQPTIFTDLTCIPSTGTVPFVSGFTVTLINNEPLRPATRIGARINVALAGGSSYSNWKSGSTNIDQGASFHIGWNQNIPALGTVIGASVFTLEAEDVTPSPYNQPPYGPAGDTDTSTCTVTGIAP